MPTVIAVARITTSAPDAPLERIGFDPTGNPILRKPNFSHMPGDFFEMVDGPELVHFLEIGAVREPSEQERALRESILSKEGGS